MVEIKALACELPATLGLPLSRLSVADVAQHAQRSGLVARISDSTVWRWLHEDAIRPWQHRCWIFPRDPQFQAKAGRKIQKRRQVDFLDARLDGVAEADVDDHGNACLYLPRSTPAHRGRSPSR